MRFRLEGGPSKWHVVPGGWFLREVNPGDPGQEVPLPRIFVARSTKSLWRSHASPAEFKIQGRRSK